MKKTQPRLKLSISTIRRLQAAELEAVAGGLSTTRQSTQCSTSCNQPPDTCSVSCGETYTCSFYPNCL
jgi:hypothetical protein